MYVVLMFSMSTWNTFLFPADIYMFKVNNRNTRTRCKICSKLTIKTPERRHTPCSSVSNVNSEQVNASWVDGVSKNFFIVNKKDGTKVRFSSNKQLRQDQSVNRSVFISNFKWIPVALVSLLTVTFITYILIGFIRT